MKPVTFFGVLALGATLTSVAAADLVPPKQSEMPQVAPDSHAKPVAAHTAAKAAAAGPSVEGSDSHGAASSGHGSGHAKEGGGHHGPGPINWTDTSNKKQPPYIALVVNFALLLYLYYRFGKKPVAEGLKKRREAIAKQIEEAAKIKAEAEDRASKYQAQLARLDEEAAAARTTIQSTGEADREQLLREAKDKASRMEKDADIMLDAERNAAKRELYEECVDKAMKRAEELLKQKLTAEDHARLAEEFLAQLARGTAREGSAGAAAAAPMDKRGDL